VIARTLDPDAATDLAQDHLKVRGFACPCPTRSERHGNCLSKSTAQALSRLMDIDFWDRAQRG
jgi:hypothetical protein